MRAVVLLAAILAAAVGGWAAIQAIDRLTADFYNFNRGVITALMLAPAIALPMIGSGTHAAHVGDYDHAVTTQVGVVLINLCAILPLVAALWMTRPMWGTPFDDPPPVVQVLSTAPATKPTTTARTKRPAKRPNKTAINLTLAADDLDLIDAHQAANPSLETRSAAVRNLLRIARAARADQGVRK